MKHYLTKGMIALGTTLILSGCLSTNPSMGGGLGGGTVTGSTAGGASRNANSQLASCTETLGTVSVFEDQSLPWWGEYRRRAPKLGSTIPVIRMMIQQSNCFVVVERGQAMKAMSSERDLMADGDLRQGSNFGKGQMVAADYTLNPSIQFAKKGTRGFAGGLAKRLLRSTVGSAGAAAVGGVKKNEAATTLLLIDNRSGVQVSAAVGNASNFDFGFGGGFFGGGMAGGAAGFTNSPEGKIITASFADSYNQMVMALRNYKAQEVKGGLGKGGRLAVGM